MENGLSLTRMPPVSPVGVERLPRPSAAPLTGASGNSVAGPAEAIPATRPQPPAGPPAVERVDLEALLERIGEQISEYSRQSGRELEFQLQTDSSRVVILVKSSDTGEVVRAIPPEEVQRLAEALDAGRPALVDLKA